MRGSSIEPAGDSHSSGWGSRSPLQVRRRKMGMKGRGSWRRSGAEEKRRGT